MWKYLLWKRIQGEASRIEIDLDLRAIVQHSVDPKQLSHLIYLPSSLLSHFVFNIWVWNKFDQNKQPLQHVLLCIRDEELAIIMMITAKFIAEVTLKFSNYMQQSYCCHLELPLIQMYDICQGMLGLWLVI